MKNRENFLFRGDAYLTTRILVPTYASRCEIQRDSEGYWINVWWHCGAIAPLTHNELNQAIQGENEC
ncbi:hypothetical protein RDp07_gp12 [Roseobacter phage RD-1410Ws-07]|uniref:Uncharacterized protein n=1 Tax=Roseobacter phage RD-1410Ws-07 TaxID=1815985 RepID=A0A191VYP0_9CAUD|nr:hypothetical protein RDp07_gp12 [Roseobacter phage RD-1410Ws-07]